MQVAIRLLDKPYSIKCPEKEVDNLQRAIKKLEDSLRKTKKQFKDLDDTAALILTAVQVSHELVVHQNEQNINSQKLTRLISSLENKVNNELEV